MPARTTVRGDDAARAAEMIDSVIAATRDGRLTADTPRSRAMLRRLEGARAALREIAKRAADKRSRRG